MFNSPLKIFTSVRIPRIYTTTELKTSSEVALDASACKHAKEVLRLKAGNSITLFNGNGFDYHGEITSIAKKSIRIVVNSQSDVENESGIKIHLLQPVCRSDRMDWCLQKATELGVLQITPFVSQRVNVHIPRDRLAKKMLHWNAVITSACEQSGRARIPLLNPPRPFNQAVETSTAESIKLVAAPESTEKLSTTTTVKEVDRCVCLVGPEGGLTVEEMEQLTNAEFKTISLGPRILRLETAVIATIALVQSNWGDMR